MQGLRQRLAGTTKQVIPIDPFLKIFYLRMITSGKLNSMTNLCAQTIEKKHLPGQEPIIHR